ncbi:MAG TPA: DinB family protein [Anaerolineales bacterium]
MSPSTNPLTFVYEGWGGYRQSIVKAVTPLAAEQLTWRPTAHLRSVGELVRHIALGPIDWFLRMGAPGSQEMARQIAAWTEDPHGNKYVVEESIAVTDQASELIKWLEISSQMIDQTLKTWTVEDLTKTYRHTWRGNTYAISRQWTIWRIMAHDLHHGGELVMMLGMQGLENFELGDLGGHIVEPPLLDEM